MKNEFLNPSELCKDKLTEQDMIKIRGGDGEEDPSMPIVKGE